MLALSQFANLRTNPAKAGWCVSPTGGTTKKGRSHKRLLPPLLDHSGISLHPSLLALPFNTLYSPVQAFSALIRFASQTYAPILLSQTGPLGQQGEPQKKERTSVLSFFCGSPCWTRTNDLAVNSRSLLPTELRRIIILSVLCGIRSLLATSGPLVATRFFASAKNLLLPSRSALG